MESAKHNKQLTEVGKGTPMGNLMRRYWQPIGALVELENKWTQRIRLLGEDLVLFKDRQGRLGLIAESALTDERHLPMAFQPKKAFAALTTVGNTTPKASASTNPMSKTNVHSETRSAPMLTLCKKWVACCGPT
jgi:hypothetical protein